MLLEKVFEFGNAYGRHTYYRVNNCFISVTVWPDMESQVNTVIENWASGEWELPDELMQKDPKPLTLYSVKAYKSSKSLSGIRTELNGQNMSLYEFCGLILKEPMESIPKGTRSAYIQHDDADVDLTIAVEPFDNESDLTNKNLNAIYSELKRLTPELKKIFGEDIEIETEVYN